MALHVIPAAVAFPGVLSVLPARSRPWALWARASGAGGAPAALKIFCAAAVTGFRRSMASQIPDSRVPVRSPGAGAGSPAAAPNLPRSFWRFTGYDSSKGHPVHASSLFGHRHADRPCGQLHAGCMGTGVRPGLSCFPAAFRPAAVCFLSRPVLASQRAGWAFLSIPHPMREVTDGRSYQPPDGLRCRAAACRAVCGGAGASGRGSKR
jgi:hypothetical protein